MANDRLKAMLKVAGALALAAPALAACDSVCGACGAEKSETDGMEDSAMADKESAAGAMEADGGMEGAMEGEGMEAKGAMEEKAEGAMDDAMKGSMEEKGAMADDAG